MVFLKEHEDFPPIEAANSDGLLAVGGGLAPKRLLDAYCKGIFPWYDPSQPVIWWSPDPRMVLFPNNLKVSKSMRQLFKKQAFSVTFNKDFEAVIRNCAKIKREGQQGTWITPELEDAFITLSKINIAHSVEVWQEDKLVGGLYGIYLKEKKVFCGESMFSKKSNASKYGFISLVKKLQGDGVRLIDCQVYTAHLESLGAEEISRREFLHFLK
jgi:leucyl/phenylalanyl-tRNA---protein transferase